MCVAKSLKRLKSEQRAQCSEKVQWENPEREVPGAEKPQRRHACFTPERTEGLGRARLIWCFLYKCEDQSLDPRIPHKSLGGMKFLIISALGKQRRGIPGQAGWLDLHESGSARNPAFNIKRNMTEKDSVSMSSLSDPISHIHENKYIHIYVCV